MPALTYAFPRQAIRDAEQPLLDAQTETDQLMRSAAHAVAIAAQVMLTTHRTEPPANRVLVLVGSGGNGGDGLYAGAALAAAGYPVDAVLLGRDGRGHRDARDAFVEAGGYFLEGFPADSHYQYSLVIDAILGIGGSGGLSPEVAVELGPLRRMNAPILSVDLPSGIDADSGAQPDAVDVDKHSFAAHIEADVTVTFGALRYAHTLSTSCGEVLVANIRVGEQTLSQQLAQLRSENEAPSVFASRALRFESPYEWPSLFISPSPEWVTSAEPGPADDKYSGGVVGLCAGSGTYPGAALLTTHGAVRATSSMVRYVGEQALEVVRAFPEVVVTERLADADRVQVWVVGPGRGTGDAARAELSKLLATDLPVLIDADALTLLAQHEELRTAVRERTQATVLTPHAGEFARLVDAMDLPGLVGDPIGAVKTLSRELDCGVVLKGRFTVIAYPSFTSVVTTVVDTGNSWAATPGSGDVLAGLMGARMAFSKIDGRQRMPQFARDEVFLPAYYALSESVQVHAVAAWLSAQTPDGPAATSASRIARYIPRATARLSVE